MPHEIIIPSTGKRHSLTPALDRIVLDMTRKASVNYAEARAALNEDFHRNKQDLGEAIAARTRKKYKRALVDMLEGVVSKRVDKADEKKYQLIVTFKDGSVANL